MTKIMKLASLSAAALLGAALINGCVTHTPITAEQLARQRQDINDTRKIFDRVDRRFEKIDTVQGDLDARRWKK